MSEHRLNYLFDERTIEDPTIFKEYVKYRIQQYINYQGMIGLEDCNDWRPYTRGYQLNAEGYPTELPIGARSDVPQDVYKITCGEFRNIDSRIEFLRHQLWLVDYVKLIRG